jgi:uncharacterized repeat protein (TIGR01451 family)
MLEGRRLLATIIVNTAADENSQTDATLSLREAIEISNGTLAVSALSQAEQAQVSGALSSPNTIDFNIPGTGPFTIAPATPLPTVTAPVIIDGYSQPGSKMNDQQKSDDAVLMVVLFGANSNGSDSFDGLQITAGGSTVEGLAINSFPNAQIELSTAGGNVVQGDRIGGAGAVPNEGSISGVSIDRGSAGNTIGGSSPAASNVISIQSAISIAGVNILISDVGSDRNLVAGNFVGTDVTGTHDAAGAAGVFIGQGVANTIGGTTAGAGNVIVSGGNLGGPAVEISDTTDPNESGGGYSSAESLTLTQFIAGGFGLDPYAVRFPSDTNGVGPLGVAYPASGGVLVTDLANGGVYRFPSNFVGQYAYDVTPVTYGPGGGAGLAKLGGVIYMTQPAQGDVVQLNDDGTLNQVIATNIPNAYGIAADPLTGHLFVSELNGAIVEIDPAAKTSSVFANVSSDGLAFDRITNTLYAALSSTTGGANNEIQGLNATTKAVVFDSGPNSIPGGPAGIAVGEGVLTGNLVANTNSGSLVEINLTTKAQTTIASGGTRGDLVTVDPNNDELLVSQSDELAYLFAPNGGGFLADQSAVGNVVQGNFIGVDASGRELGPSGSGNVGVWIANSSGNLIGGTVPGAGNTMAFGSDGVEVFSGRGNAIESNSIHDMSVVGLGINIDAGGIGGGFIKPNSPGGPHTGDPNDSQNYPVLTSASFDRATGITTFQGTLNSTPNSTFRIEFFASPQAGPSGHGLGQTFLGALSAASPNPVTTDSDGNASFTFTTTAGNLAGQSISATATDPEGNTSEFAADVVVSGGTTIAPDLALSGNAPTSVTLGQNVTDTLKVTNNGTAGATGVTLTDTLPAGVSFISATGGVTPVNGVLTFHIGNLAVGASNSVTIVFRPTAASQLSDSASVSGNEPDPTPSDNTLTLPTTVSAATGPDLALSGSAPSAVMLGQTVTESLKVTNNGTAVATGVTLTDTLPRGVTFVSARGGATPVNGVLTFHMGNLGVGASSSVTIVFRLTATGQLSDSASVSGNEPDPTPADNSLTLPTTVSAATAPDLALSGDAPAAVALGQNVTDTLKVTNNGTALATGVTLTDTLARGVTLVSATGGVTPVEGDLTFEIGNLAAGASATVTIVVKATAVGPLRDQAHVTMSQNDPTPDDNAITLATAVSSPPSSTGPVVTGVHRLGIHARPTTLVLSFNEPLDPPTAQNAGNYQIVSMGRTGFRSGPDPLIRVKQALYNASTETVTLVPVERLNLHDLFRLTVIGTGPGGVTDASGNLLDGDGSGDPGTNYITIVSASNLLMTTTNPAIVAKYQRIVSHQAPFLRVFARQGGARTS